MMGWEKRVRFAPDGTFAYHPGRVLVKLGPSAGAESRRRSLHRTEWIMTLELDLDAVRLLLEGLDRYLGIRFDEDDLRALLQEIQHVRRVRFDRAELTALLNELIERHVVDFSESYLEELPEALVGDSHSRPPTLEKDPPPDLPSEHDPRRGAAIPVGFGWFRVEFPPQLDAVRAVRFLKSIGFSASVDHVMFATSCCGPHPAWWSHPALNPNPVFANPVFANPVFANPVFANPVFANPVFANPVFANPVFANPVFANPVFANPVFANPVFANTNPNPGNGLLWAATGERRSTARPAEDAGWKDEESPPNEDAVRIVVLDSGYWSNSKSFVQQSIDTGRSDPDDPDEDGDDYLDPVAGHGTFIAGLIAHLAPKCWVEVRDLMEPEGDLEVSAVTSLLQQMKDTDALPDVINMSFGGYADDDMPALGDAIAGISDTTIVVASAGNDATCTPLYPAAFPQVIAVGALERVTCPTDCRSEQTAHDERGHTFLAPALFTNYGPWVDCSALGVDIVSTFFFFQGDEEAAADWQSDPDHFTGWARWSGTSFAAPRVAAAIGATLATQIGEPDLGAAVKAVLEPEDRKTLPMLGTVVEF